MADSLADGEVSQAMQIGERHNRAANTPQVRLEYVSHVTRNLNPESIPIPPDEIEPFQGSDHHKIAKAIRGARKRSSGGPSKWRFSHVQGLLKSQEIITCRLLNFITILMANDELPSETCKQLFRVSKGVPIPKPNSTVIRPLAVGETFRRLACKILADSIGLEAIEHAAGPHQFAAGTPCGTDLAGFVPRVALQTHPGLVLSSSDCANAFQNIDRAHTLKEIKKYLPAA